jgi:hypothetical protein
VNPLLKMTSRTAANAHKCVFGMSGSGKTTFAVADARAQQRPTVFVDPNRNLDTGFDKVESLRFTAADPHPVLYIDYTTDDFPKLVSYLFNLYRVKKWQHRMGVYIDEADVFCGTSPEDVQRLCAQGRRFFDLTLISTKPSLMRTPAGYVALSQSSSIVAYAMRENDIAALVNHAGVNWSPEVAAHVAKPYHYAVFGMNGTYRLEGPVSNPGLNTPGTNGRDNVRSTGNA